MFACICSFADPNLQKKVLPSELVDGILCCVCLLPLVRVNLRAPLRADLSITDASERAGSAAEAVSF